VNRHALLETTGALQYAAVLARLLRDERSYPYTYVEMQAAVAIPL